MPNGEEKPQSKSDKQKRCSLCNRDDFTLNPFDQNVANDVKTLFDADIECKETRKICLHCSFQIKFIKLSAKNEPNHRNPQNHYRQRQQNAEQRNSNRSECCRELFENPVYLHEIRKKYRRYVDKFVESRRKPVKESSSSSKQHKFDSFPSPCSSCSGTISTPSTPTSQSPAKSLQKASNLSPKQSVRFDDKAKKFASHDKHVKIDEYNKTNSDDGKDKEKDLIKNETTDNNVQEPNANGELKSKSSDLGNKMDEKNSLRAKHQSRHPATYTNTTADSNNKMEIDSDECSSNSKEEEKVLTIERPMKEEKKIHRRRLNGNVEQFMDDARCKSKSKPIKIPTNTRKIAVELPKSQTKCKPPSSPIQIPTKKHKFGSFDAALSESSAVVQSHKKPTKLFVAQPSAESVTKAPETKPEQKQEHLNEQPKAPATATATTTAIAAKKRNYMNVNGIQIELPDGVENNSEWFKCVVRLNRLKRKSNAMDEIESMPSAPKRQQKRKKLENFDTQAIDLNITMESNDNVATSIENISCITPKSILLESSRQQAASIEKKRVSFYGIGAGDTSDDEPVKPKKLFAKEKRSIEKKTNKDVKEKSPIFGTSPDTSVNNDASIIVHSKKIVESHEMRSPKKQLSVKKDGIQTSDGKSDKTDKNSRNLAVDSIQNEIADKSAAACVVVPSEIINECSSSSVEPIHKKKRKTKADKLTINNKPATKKSISDNDNNSVAAPKPIERSNISAMDTQTNSEMDPSKQINLTDTTCDHKRSEDVINDCHVIEAIGAPNGEKRKTPKQKQKQEQKPKLRGPQKSQSQSISENSVTDSLVWQNQSRDMTASAGFCAIAPTIEIKPKKMRKVKKSIVEVNDEKATIQPTGIQSNVVVSADVDKIIKAANETVIEAPVVLNHEIANECEEEVTFVSDMDPLALVESETISPTVVEDPFEMPEILAPVVESFDSVTLKMRISNGRVINQAGKTSPQNASPNEICDSEAMVHRTPRTMKKKNSDPDLIESDDLSPVEECSGEILVEKKKHKSNAMPKRRKIEQNAFHSSSPENAPTEDLRGQFGDRIFDAFVKLNRNPNIDQALYGDGSVVVRFETPNIGLPHCMQSTINQTTVDSEQISNEARTVVSNDCDTSYSNVDINMENAPENVISESSENIAENIVEDIAENIEDAAAAAAAPAAVINDIHESYEPDSVTTIQTDEYSLNIIQEPFISVGNSCIESPMIPILSEIEPNSIGFESPTATVDSTTSGYSSATTTSSTICSLELVPAQFHIGPHEVAISINNYVTSNNINSSNYDDEASGIYFSNIANCVGIGSSLEQINTDDIISVFGKPMDNNELSMDDDGIGMDAFETTSPTNHVVSRNYYLNDYNPLNAFNSGHSLSSPNGIVFRTKAALKQIDIPGLVSMNDSYCNDLSSAPNELSTKLLRNDNPLLNHHSSGSVDETAIEIREASSSFSTVADSMVTSSETISISPLPSTRRSGLNITISTPSKGTSHATDLNHGDMLFDIFEENQRQLLNTENFPTTTTPVEPPFDLNSYNY